MFDFSENEVEIVLKCLYYYREKYSVYLEHLGDKEIAELDTLAELIAYLES